MASDETQRRGGSRAYLVAPRDEVGPERIGRRASYVQFAAASAVGKRAVTTTLNIPAPTGRLLKRLRAVQETAVCAVLK